MFRGGSGLRAGHLVRGIVCLLVVSIVAACGDDSDRDAPAAPADVVGNRIYCITTPCDFAHVTWKDRSDDEDGFRVSARWVSCEGKAGTPFEVGRASRDAEIFMVEEIEIDAAACGIQLGVSAYNEAGESAVVWSNQFL